MHNNFPLSTFLHQHDGNCLLILLKDEASGDYLKVWENDPGIKAGHARGKSKSLKELSELLPFGVFFFEKRDAMLLPALQEVCNFLRVGADSCQQDSVNVGQQRSSLWTQCALFCMYCLVRDLQIPLAESAP
jgi:hypothetical protein